MAVPLCLAVMLQGGICIAVLQGSNTSTRMETDAYELFAERVSSHAGYLENDMVFRWSDFDVVATAVGADIDALEDAAPLAARGLKNGSPEALAVIEATAQRLVDFTRRAEVDGVYFILNEAAGTSGGTSPAGGARAGLYIRDANPKVDVPNNSDLLLSVCPISVGKRLGIALDTGWAASWQLAPENQPESDFYYRPLRAAERYPDAQASDLGYWGHPVDLGWAGTQTITYSMPVRDRHGVAVGILGIEVRLDRVTSYLPYRDLGQDDEGSYLLAITGEEGGFARDGGVVPTESGSRDYEVLATTGASQSLYVDDERIAVELAPYDRLLAMPAEEDSDAGAAMVAATELDLYDATSPFADEHWAVLGLERNEALFAASYDLQRNLLTVLAISLLVGLAIAGATAWLSSSRMRSLMGEVRAARPERSLEFAPTGIAELDELACAISKLGAEVASSASRLSQILRLSERSIAAFESNREDDTVVYTAGFFETMGIVGAHGDDVPAAEGVNGGGMLPIAEFKRELAAFGSSVEQEAEGRWLVADADKRRWVRIVAVPSPDNTRLFGLVEDVTDEIATRRRIEHERDHDVLTGLLNRRAFEQEVTERLAANPPAFAAMLMLDLDNLKYINDTYGHDWGDHYIKAAARVIEDTFASTGFFARISGDEFLVFVDRCANAQKAEELFEAFMRALDTSVLEAPDATVLKVRASVGVAYYPDDAGDFCHLREFADFAMYEAKNRRKGALLRFDPKSHVRGSFILSNKENLNRLLDENLIGFHFQPIVDAQVGEVVAYEALMRPQLPALSTPDKVLLLAQSQSKLYRVEHLTFFGALGAFSQHRCAGDAVLFVNSIATQRLSADDELELQQRFGPLLKRLVIEITESEYSPEMALYKERLAQRWGARLAIDDFGSGYNGETSLLDYHVDFVKLDMGVVRNINQMKDHQDIARNLISYAHDRGIRVVAEGVETTGELTAVLKLGVDYVQGYLVGRPDAEPPAVADEVRALICRLAGEALREEGSHGAHGPAGH